ncbi:MAG: porphobilinogen synthase [Armatimonadetes bacterium]|nr:porphobilinogen synthase [Anaerolineae bacterium]
MLNHLLTTPKPLILPDNETLLQRPLLQRPRRLRHSQALRRLVRETTLTPVDFIMPLFIHAGDDLRQPIHAMPGQNRLSVAAAAQEARHLALLGISAVLLFGIPHTKDASGSDNFAHDGIIPRAIDAIKQAAPDMVVISDMCFCEYTNHGHCGLINQHGLPEHHAHLPEGYLLNDETLDLLRRASVVHAQAGADIIAPSGMLDGMVGGIREALDLNGFEHTAIMSYAVKTASAFYGPFREAAGSTPSFGDRKQYQMDYANGREALREVALDVAEGADILMIKPALPNLDILHAVRQSYNLPTAAYQVSGEYAMLHAAAAQGWLDLQRCALESLVSIKRAGADMIVTYFAKDAVAWLD